MCIFCGAALSKAICWSAHFDDGPVLNRRWQLKMIMKIIRLLICTYYMLIKLQSNRLPACMYRYQVYFLLVAGTWTIYDMEFTCILNSIQRLHKSLLPPSILWLIYGMHVREQSLSLCPTYDLR